MIARGSLALVSSWSALAALLLAVPACGADDPASVAEGVSLPGADATPCQDRPRPPPRCERDGDCGDVCPPGAVGCVCRASPMGPRICVPVCRADADCPSVGDRQLTCREGVCAPAMRAPHLRACQADGECGGACGPSRSCACRETPRGRACIPTCRTAADCPSPPGIGPLACHEGVCVPPR